jgi:mono/diheme cytochrome c family protein
MRRLRIATLLTAVLVALVALAVGCGESDPDEAVTPASAQTVKNGEYLGDGEEEVEGEGDPAVAAGKTAFEGKCQACHPAGGAEAGTGPVLKDKGLTPDVIETQIVNGKGVMPAGLATGEELTNIVAYVASIQGVEAPPAAGGGTSTDGEAPAGGEEPSDDAVTAGLAVFTSKCQGCHGEGGVNGPAGPPLADKGLVAEAIRNQVVNGGGAMPAGLAAGKDLDDVVAYVLSLQ